ncbi:hypothetical protein HAX54_031814 [Datura stramonium]|uniref:Uncharacterized protein n=1 Tax=Datura stramonium TaxID=4076 RepID=A0ABS8SCE8_DATST|nr:hypothetical protein [Datura stramonium]
MAFGTTLPHLREQQCSTQALLHEERREAPAMQRDTVHDAHPFLCDARCSAPFLPGCQQGNPFSTRKKSYKSQIISGGGGRVHDVPLLAEEYGHDALPLSPTHLCVMQLHALGCKSVAWPCVPACVAPC